MFKQASLGARCSSILTLFFKVLSGICSGMAAQGFGAGALASSGVRALGHLYPTLKKAPRGIFSGLADKGFCVGALTFFGGKGAWSIAFLCSFFPSYLPSSFLLGV